MTRHEAVEEGEKTHTELVLAARQGGAARGSLCSWGTCGMPAWGGLWDGADGPRVGGGGCRAQGEGEHTDELAGRQSRRHAGEPEGGHNSPWSYAEEILRVEREFFCHHGLFPEVHGQPPWPHIVPQDWSLPSP